MKTEVTIYDKVTKLTIVREGIATFHNSMVDKKKHIHINALEWYMRHPQKYIVTIENK